MDDGELTQQWQRWIEKNIGGPQARVETATQAAIGAIGQRKSRDEIVAAVRQAATGWESTKGTPSHPQGELQQQWRGWIEKNIGGSTARIEDATQAAMTAIGQRKSLDEIVAVVHQASARWEEPEARSVLSSSEVRPGIIRGRVAGLQQHQEMAQWAGSPATLVQNFRVERARPDGAPLPTVAVEMRGTTFMGSMINGDEVEIEARGYKPGDVIKPQKIRNLTTDSWKQPDAPSAIASTESRPGIIRGRVFALQQRQEMGRLNITVGRMAPPYTLVWSFRIGRIGPDNVPLPPVAVEMRGRTFTGYLAEGDEVELNATGYEPGSLIRPREIRNITSNSTVRARGYSFGRVAGLIFGLVFLLIWLAVAYSMMAKH